MAIENIVGIQALAPNERTAATETLSLLNPECYTQLGVWSGFELSVNECQFSQTTILVDKLHKYTVLMAPLTAISHC